MEKFIITDDLDDLRIINFLNQHEQASIYHHPGWLKALRNSFGHKAYYLIQEKSNNDIIGLLPFILIDSFVTGKRIVSLPFSTYCDPLISNNLIQEAIQVVRNTFPQFKKIEFKTLQNLKGSLKNFSLIKDYVTHILPLKESIEETFKAFHPTSVRASIRRAEKNDLKIKYGSTIKDLKIFYDLEVRLRKRLGLPPLPFVFFKNIWKELSVSDNVSIPLVVKDNQVIAAGFILNFKDTFYLEYTASLKNTMHFYPNHKLFYDVIKKAHNYNAVKVDFGRSDIDNISLIKFKEKWNAEGKFLYHYRYPADNGFFNNSNSLPKKVFKTINSFLPARILEIEGRMVYPHMG